MFNKIPLMSVWGIHNREGARAEAGRPVTGHWHSAAEVMEAPIQHTAGAAEVGMR